MSSEIIVITDRKTTKWENIKTYSYSLELYCILNIWKIKYSIFFFLSNKCFSLSFGYHQQIFCPPFFSFQDKKLHPFQCFFYFIYFFLYKTSLHFIRNYKQINGGGYCHACYTRKCMNNTICFYNLSCLLHQYLQFYPLTK